MDIIRDIQRFTQRPITEALMRTTPDALASDTEARMALTSAFHKQQRERDLPDYTIDNSISKNPENVNIAASSTPYIKQDPPTGKISINENADRAFYAHELGHNSAAQKGLGKAINDLRLLIQQSPKTKQALTAAMRFGPFAASAMIPGSGDLATALAIGLAPKAITLANEAQASMHALDLLKRADMKATGGQRARLAGAFMSYATPSLLYGVSGNLLGNLSDDDIAREIYGIDPNDV